MCVTFIASAADQQELEIDEAVQQAAESTVPSCGYPIYEEIDSAYMLGSLRNDAFDATSNDEDYVAISTDAVEYVSNFLLCEESKVVQDKYETSHVSHCKFRGDNNYQLSPLTI
jgi:hypothetical protein